MSNPFIAAFDLMAHGAFTAAGIADLATYTSSTGSVIPDCKILIDRNVVLTGDQGQMITDQITITCFLADVVSRPKRGATFLVGSETFKVDSIARSDESSTVCVVKAGT